MSPPLAQAGLASPGLFVMTANLHLFGRLGRVGPEQTETPLYLKDFKRLEALTGYLRGAHPHVVALEEVWDPFLQHEIARALGDIYPYHMFTPWETGVTRAIEAVSERIGVEPSRVEEVTNDIIKELARSHYHFTQSLILRLLGKVFSEDLAIRLFQRVFRVSDLWGAGLLFLSQFPIDRMQSRFEPHEQRADLDRCTRKGILKAVLTVPEMGALTVLATHLQEGKSRRAVAARADQLRAMRGLIDRSDYPVIALGDFNVERDLPPRGRRERRQFPRMTAEFRQMMEILRLRDAYTGSGVDLRRRPGRTYLHGPYARQMGIPETTDEREITIDYILHDSNFEATAAAVDHQDFFLDPEKKIPLSDHRPLYALLVKKG